MLTSESEGYIQIAKRLGDSLPDDEFLGAGDLDYEERLKPLERLATESDDEEESDNEIGEESESDKNSDKNEDNEKEDEDEESDD